MQLKPPKGEHRRPTFILGDFAEAFVGGRSPFEEVAMRKAILLGVHTVGSRRVLGEFLEGFRHVLGRSSAISWKGAKFKRKLKAARGSAGRTKSLFYLPSTFKKVT